MDSSKQFREWANKAMRDHIEYKHIEQVVKRIRDQAIEPGTKSYGLDLFLKLISGRLLESATSTVTNTTNVNQITMSKEQAEAVLREHGYVKAE